MSIVDSDSEPYRKIYFLVVPNTTLGSTQLRAVQVGDELVKYGYTCEIIPFGGHSEKNWETMVSVYKMSTEFLAKLNQIRNSIVIILKNLFLKDYVVEMIKNNQNIVILDTIDIWYFLEKENDHLLDVMPFYDAVLVYNTHSQKKAREHLTGMKRCEVIYHHWDVRLEKKTMGVGVGGEKEKFAIGFCGQSGTMLWTDVPNCLYLDQFPEIEQKEANSLGYWPCYYTVRYPDSLQSGYKSNIKLSNAAAVGSNIVTTLDKCVEDLIDPNYPYLTTHHQDDVEKTLAFAKETYGGPVWQYGLDLMEAVRRKTDLKNIIHDYLKLFTELVAERAVGNGENHL